MVSKAHGKSAARAAASARANARRAARRAEMETYFRSLHKPANLGDIFDERDFIEPLEVLEEVFDDYSVGDIEMVARKLGNECRWLPNEYPARGLTKSRRDGVAADGVLLLRAQDIVGRGDPDLLLFGTPQEQVARAPIREALSRVEALLVSARDQADDPPRGGKDSDGRLRPPSRNCGGVI